MYAQTANFVILKHITPDNTHYDFMLEKGTILSTWRIGIPPAQLSSNPAKAEKISDHDPKFLTYQGPVNNNTATVKTADKGTFTILEQTTRKIRFRLSAQIINGIFTLTQKNENVWQIEPDKINPPRPSQARHEL